MKRTDAPKTKSLKKRKGQAHFDWKQDPNYSPNWEMTNNREPNQEEAVVKHFGSEKAKKVLISASSNRASRRHPYVKHRNIFTKKMGSDVANIIKADRLTEYFIKKAEAVKKFNEELEKKKAEIIKKIKKELEEKEAELKGKKKTDKKKPKPKKSPTEKSPGPKKEGGDVR